MPIPNFIPLFASLEVGSSSFSTDIEKMVSQPQSFTGPACLLNEIQPGLCILCGKIGKDLLASPCEGFESNEDLLVKTLPKKGAELLAMREMSGTRQRCMLRIGRAIIQQLAAKRPSFGSFIQPIDAALSVYSCVRDISRVSHLPYNDYANHTMSL